MNKIILVLIVMLSAGCTTIRHNAPPPVKTHISYPELGQENVAYIGDQLLRKGIMFTEDVLVISKDINVSALMSPILIPAGEYAKIGSDNTTDFYSSNGICSIIGSIKNCQFSALSVGKQINAELCVVDLYGGDYCYAEAYARSTRTVKASNNFVQTLLYNGRVGNKINIGYREFNKTSARPAFSNDVEYDLNTSSTIGYKGAKLEVIDADNSSITYKVIRNFRDREVK